MKGMAEAVKQKIRPDYMKFMRKPGPLEFQSDIGSHRVGSGPNDIPWAEILQQGDGAAARQEPRFEYAQVEWEELSATPPAEVEPTLAYQAALDPPPLPFLLAAAWMLFALVSL
jgi:hypothetical protein